MPHARAVLHLGLPKTGTSFLQGTLRANHQTLDQAGIRLPGVGPERLFGAVLHVTERSDGWGRPADQGRKAWERILQRTHSAPGRTMVVSSETLCLAKPHQVERIVGDFDGVDLDVVVTVRELSRQLPAEWQEGVKHGRVLTLREYLDVVFSENELPPVREQARRRFWNAQDPVRVLDRWGEHVGPDRLHVVTCPPAGTDPQVLWDRFARVIGAADVPVDIPDRPGNTSLGPTQTELLRRLNRRFPRAGDEKAYGALVKRLYAGTILRGQGDERVRIPRRFQDRVARAAEEQIGALGERDLDLVGDLDDLRPRFAGTGPAKLDRDRLVDAGVEATAELLREVGRLREELRRLRAENEKLRGERG